MNVEKWVDFVLTTLALLACIALFYGALQLLPGAVDQMFSQWDNHTIQEVTK